MAIFTTLFSYSDHAMLLGISMTHITLHFSINMGLVEKFYPKDSDPLFAKPPMAFTAHGLGSMSG